MTRTSRNSQLSWTVASLLCTACFPAFSTDIERYETALVDGTTVVVHISERNRREIERTDADAVELVPVDLQGDGHLDLIVRTGWDSGWNHLVFLNIDSTPRRVLHLEGAAKDFDLVDANLDGKTDIIFYLAHEEAPIALDRYVSPRLYLVEEKELVATPMSCVPILRSLMASRLEISRQIANAEIKKQKTGTSSSSSARAIQAIFEKERLQLLSRCDDRE